jgi:Outer membrane protein beta-barrel domain
MRTDKHYIGLLAFVLLMSVLASAQAHELAITAGGQFPSNNLFDSGTSFAVGANYAGRIVHFPLAALYFEVPVVVGPKSVTRLPSRSNYSSLFITPGLKLKLAPEFPLSPYVAAGIGYARFHQDANASVSSQSVNTEVYDFGGGLDLKIAPFVSLRGEVRDFYSGFPDFNSLSNTGRQHNLVAQAGLVLRF